MGVRVVQIGGSPENPSPLVSFLRRKMRVSGKRGEIKEKEEKSGKWEWTLSSSSLEGDLKALLTAVNQEDPPFLPMKRRRRTRALHLHVD